MAFSTRHQLTYWGIAGAALFAVLWFLGDVLLPFVLGAAIAYFLDPLADKLERLGLSRVLAVLVISLAVVIVLLPAVIFVLSTLTGQIAALGSLSVPPDLINEVEERLQNFLPSALTKDLDLETSIAQLAEFVRSRAEQLFNSFGGHIFGALMSSAASLFNIVLLLVIVPVVTVYLLLDWDRMIARLDTFLPRDHAPTVRRIASEIDHTLSSFVRGMGSVCLILGSYYAISLWLVGLNFGLAVGFFAGLVTFIPYLGSLVGGALAIGLGLIEFWGEWGKLGLVAGIFFLGQVIEGNYLTPKLVGQSVGLHPVWLLLALSVFGALFGFLGMLIAVPVAATLGVLVRFGLDQYKNGRLYKGLSETDEKL
tara:strand:- start:236 stop:1336 length:1101 start_codon:yes stop_codon:yes gene_type:complete